MKQIAYTKMNPLRKDALTKVCHELNITLKEMKVQDTHRSIGSLFSAMTDPKAERDTDVHAEEMIIMYGFNNDDLDTFLNAYKKTKAPPIPLKAIVTMHNSRWSASALYQELVKERTEILNRTRRK